ncbi:MAG: mechanosensitive ion channel family protein [Balneolaceae bacterium]|nr:MAG: mechanosensitive ion channel family protein [Balneolaceae bacterium]
MELQDILTTAQDILEIEIFSVQGDPVTVGSLIVFFFFFIGFLIFGSVVRRLLQGRILKRFDIDPGIQFTLARITQYVIVVIGILISFQFLEINLTSLAVIFGLLSVGIGFGLQNITANFISGLIIMFERPITVGDRVEVGDKEGDVIEINIRSTKIRTLNNISIIVPNTQFVENDVINYSLGDPSFRLDIPVGVAYSSNLDTVLKALNEVADEHPKVMKQPRHQVHLAEFGDSAWEMQLRVWIPNVKERYILRNELNQAIVRKFEKMKVEIPFPQRDLHLRSSIDLPVNTRFNKEENPGS